MKKIVVPLVTFKNEAEVRDFERRIREAHNQLHEGDGEYEEPSKKEGVNPQWQNKKPPGILKALIPHLFPPRAHHKKQKL